MIQSKEDLKEYLVMDKIALNCTRRRPKLFSDEIWRFEVVLRKHEYYTNCACNPWMKMMRRFYSILHKEMGIRLGLQIPCNVFRGGCG